MTWFFYLDDDGVVQAHASVEGDNSIGDAFEEIRKGGNLYGVKYADLAAAKSGRVEVYADGVGHLKAG